MTRVTTTTCPACEGCCYDAEGAACARCEETGVVEVVLPSPERLQALRDQRARAFGFADARALAAGRRS